MGAGSGTAKPREALGLGWAEGGSERGSMKMIRAEAGTVPREVSPSKACTPRVPKTPWNTRVRSA